MSMQPSTFRFGIAGRTACVIGLVACIGAGAFVIDAFAQGGPRGPRGTDYWQPGWMHRHMWAPRSMHPDVRARMRRHWAYMHVGIPSEYAGARSPLAPTAKVIGEGRALYTKHCASCHGASGMGDGQAGKSLTPSPALLAYMIQRPMAVDEYLLWSIADGGKNFDTAMPAFKSTLSRTEIWKIVAYMRSGFLPAQK